ncbi:MAG: AAA family ATPase [Clostridia bacterium]|nr:AAA family ATPase [Clostridia bacterium]
MKKLYMIGGAMGVGKTTVCQTLKAQLPNCVFLDGDWCWDADPFCVTEETKQMVLNNICYLLNSFIGCSAYQNIVFCWVMHEQGIIDSIVNRLDTKDCAVVPISLLANEETIQKRIMDDVDKGKRTEDVFLRSLNYLPRYHTLNTAKIETDGKTPARIAQEIGWL